MEKEHESELWLRLYGQRVEDLRSTYVEMNNAEKRGSILAGLDSLIMTSQTTSLDTARRPKRQAPRKADRYIDTLDDVVAEKVRETLKALDLEQVDLLVREFTKARIANDLGMSQGTLGSTLSRLRRGLSEGYRPAQLIHWLLQHGYQNHNDLLV